MKTEREERIVYLQREIDELRIKISILRLYDKLDAVEAKKDKAEKKAMLTEEWDSYLQLADKRREIKSQIEELRQKAKDLWQ
jgi:uncharacterized coiled-coil DUF342 family protein